MADEQTLDTNPQEQQANEALAACAALAASPRLAARIKGKEIAFTPGLRVKG